MNCDEILKAIEQRETDRAEFCKAPDKELLLVKDGYSEWTKNSKIIEILDKQILDLKICYIFEKVKAL